MVSKPLFMIPKIFCIFLTNLAMATLGLKEMGKFLWEGREKGLENAKKSGIMKSGLDTSFPLRRSVKMNEFFLTLINCILQILT